MSEKLLDIIPKNLHPQLIEEVKELIAKEDEDDEKENERKKKTEVSDLMKDYLSRHR